MGTCLITHQWLCIYFYSKDPFFHFQTTTYTRLVKRISLNGILSIQTFLFYLVFCFGLVKTEWQIEAFQFYCCCLCSAELCVLSPKILSDKEIVSILFCSFTHRISQPNPPKIVSAVNETE